MPWPLPFRRFWFPAAALLALSGCTLGPRYQAPAPTLQPFHSAPAPAAPAPPLDTWWQGFADPTLTRLVERALAENLDLAASLERVDQAREAALIAGARRKPAGSLNAQSSSIRQSLESPVGRYAGAFPTFNRNQSYLDLGLAASWEADLFGTLRRGVEAASAEAQAADADRLGTRVSIAAETADAYLQIRGLQARLAVLHDQIAVARRLLALVTQRRAAGLATDREQAQSEALLRHAQSGVPLLETALEAQRNRLDVLLGVQPGTLAAELQAPADLPAAPSLTGLADPAALLRRRPDIIAAERRIAAAHARLGQSLTEYYPKLSLSAFLGSQAINPGNLLRPKGFQPTALIGLRWRLFDFGRVDAEVRQARGVRAEALLAFRQAVLRAAEDVENAFTLLQQSELRRQEIALEIDALQRARDRSQEAFEAGVIALTDVLDADRQLLTARDQLTLARESAARAAVGSFRALGGGWTR